MRREVVKTQAVQPKTGLESCLFLEDSKTFLLSTENESHRFYKHRAGASANSGETTTGEQAQPSDGPSIGGRRLFRGLPGVTVYEVGGGGGSQGGEGPNTLPEPLLALIEGMMWGLLNGAGGIGGLHMQGQPPASDAAIAELEVVDVSVLAEVRKRKRGEEDGGDEKCVVCQDEFVQKQDGDAAESEGGGDDGDGEEYVVLRMPCQHLFHGSCLKPWLKTSNTCPTCRYEIMTDNADYNVGVTERMAARAAGDKSKGCASGDAADTSSGSGSTDDSGECVDDDNGRRKRRRLVYKE
ncbi:hypothetical protein HDU79_009954 [Rhizoclosmatium sp. JEL0117]|nr:hypothetical protein HDU79_009954 [Rhizoclosmatium sp. JEL0117]